MKNLFLFFILSILPLVHAQTAKVIALTPQESKRAQDLDLQQKQLDAEKKTFHDLIQDKYLIQTQPQNPVWWGCTTMACSPTYLKSGWETGLFEFSEDWKYIVPSKPNVSASTSCYNQMQWVTPVSYLGLISDEGKKAF